jgi:hypothetical protein
MTAPWDYACESGGGYYRLAARRVASTAVAIAEEECTNVQDLGIARTQRWTGGWWSSIAEDIAQRRGR